MEIRALQAQDIESVQNFTVNAFKPIFESFENIMGEKVFPIVYSDWRQVHRDHVTNFYNDDNMTCLIAVIDDKPAGFIVYHMQPAEKTGMIEFLVVNPDYQNRGVGTELNQYVIDIMRQTGIKVVSVSTGGDPSHEPAQKAYEKVGFKPFPNIWYYQYLD